MVLEREVSDLSILYADWAAGQLDSLMVVQESTSNVR